MNYGLILSDPPWQVSKGGARKVRPAQEGNGALDYPTLSLDDIQVIQASAMEHAEPNHTLFLWTVDKYLHQAEELVRPLGYKLHARLIWDKQNGIAPAFTVRFAHEYLLWFYLGKFQHVAPNQRGKWMSVLHERSTVHSRKPVIASEMIEALYPNVAKLELFARRQRPGWDVWGNELPNSVSL